MVYLTRKEHFNAAHQLYNPEWSEARNEEVYGKCANRNFHGHNFEVYVTIKGKPHLDEGWIMNVKDLSKIINKEICDQFDHKNMNVDIPFMQGVIPTIENVIMIMWQRLLPHLPDNCKLHCIKLVETERIYAEYYGE